MLGYIHTHIVDSVGIHCAVSLWKLGGSISYLWSCDLPLFSRRCFSLSLSLFAYNLGGLYVYSTAERKSFHCALETKKASNFYSLARERERADFVYKYQRLLWKNHANVLPRTRSEVCVGNQSIRIIADYTRNYIRAADKNMYPFSMHNAQTVPWIKRDLSFFDALSLSESSFNSPRELQNYIESSCTRIQVNFVGYYTEREIEKKKAWHLNRCIFAVLFRRTNSSLFTARQSPF